MTNTVLMIVAAVIVLLLLITAFILQKKRKTPTNYKSFFIIGITWIPLGIIMKNYVFSLLGVLFLIYGLLNKSKWKDYPKWSELPPELRRIKIFIMVILSVILIAGIIVYFLYQR